MLLQVEGLTKTYTLREGWPVPRNIELQALDNVSFSVNRGEALGVVGESGCGKSTAARSVLRLVEPNKGRILFDGQDIMQASGAQLRAFRRRMQMVFQDPSSALDPRQRIGAALSEPLRVHGIAKGEEADRLVKAVLDEVGLPASAVNRFPHEFSGGQRQRIGIARALILQPDLIIADEPVSALDVSVQAQILTLLSGLKKARMLAFVFISHDLGVVRHFCERTVVMYLGRVIEAGPTKALFDAPAHPYTQLLRTASPVPDPRAQRNLRMPEGEPPSPLNPPSGCHFHPRCERATELCRREAPVLRLFPADIENDMAIRSAEQRIVACHHA